MRFHEITNGSVDRVPAIRNAKTTFSSCYRPGGRTFLNAIIKHREEGILKMAIEAGLACWVTAAVRDHLMLGLAKVIVRKISEVGGTP